MSSRSGGFYELIGGPLDGDCRWLDDSMPSYSFAVIIEAPSFEEFSIFAHGPRTVSYRRTLRGHGDYWGMFWEYIYVGD